MLRNSKGYFLIDLLCSLAALVLITSGLIPIYLHLSKQSISLERKLQATYILFDELLTSDSEFLQNKLIVLDNSDYKVVWNGGEEVCVYYQDGLYQSKEICKYAER